MKVEIKPIENQAGWMNLQKDQSFKRPITIEALVDNEAGVYKTGLNEEEQKEYSDMIGIDLSNKLRYENGNIAEHPFYHSKVGRIKLENNTMIFNTENVIDRVKIALMKASPFVANSLTELDDFPEATHYIHSEEEEVEVKANKLAMRNTCILEAAKLTAADKASVVSILSTRTVKNRSDNFIDVEINTIIDEKPEEFLKTLQMDKKEMTIRAQILDALRRNILTKEGMSICYMGEMLAEDYEGTVKWFKNPQNQKVKIAILEKLK